MQPVPHASRTARSKPGLYNAELGYCNKELYEYELFFAAGTGPLDEGQNDQLAARLWDRSRELVGA